MAFSLWPHELLLFTDIKSFRKYHLKSKYINNVFTVVIFDAYEFDALIYREMEEKSKVEGVLSLFGTYE